MNRTIWPTDIQTFLDSKNVRKRPSIDVWGIMMAQVAATRATCIRRAVGCVLLDENRQIVGQGYNGRHRGSVECNSITPHISHDIANPDLYQVGAAEAGSLEEWVHIYFPHSCSGATAAPGTSMGSCEAVHAEMNALIGCKDRWAIHTCYATVSPCIECTKALLNTSCKRIVFVNEYPHPESKKLWLRDGSREWLKIDQNQIDPYLQLR